MRYTEPKARSAEWLRLALGHMGRHEAAFNPVTFTLWYEYASGINPQLTAAIDQLTGDSAAIDDATVLRLYKKHVAAADEAAMERISGELQRLMSGVEESAAQTGSRAGVFGAQLTGLSEALESRDVHTLTPHLSEVLAGTAEMKSSAQALQLKVTSSQNEIGRLRDELERARGEAMLDPLTGILNRKGFDQKLQALLDQPSAAGACHCLVMLDIDHFKKVNDSHGHVVGDRVIQAVGEILRTSLTNATHAAARYGGEEFAIVLPHTSLEQCTQLAEVVLSRTKAMRLRNRTTQEVLLTVTISAGIAEMKHGDDAATLIARADAALYASKNGGRDRVTCA